MLALHILCLFVLYVWLYTKHKNGVHKNVCVCQLSSEFKCDRICPADRLEVYSLYRLKFLDGLWIVSFWLCNLLNVAEVLVFVAEEEVKERARRAAAASRRWREYSRRGADKPPTYKLPETVSNKEQWAVNLSIHVYDIILQICSSVIIDRQKNFNATWYYLNIDVS